MTETGISVYPDLQDEETVNQCLAMAGKYGCTYVFASMFSVEEETEKIIAGFKAMSQMAHSCGLKTIYDVNAAFLGKIGAAPDDLSLLNEAGCDVLRMDLPYRNPEDNLALTKNPYGIVIALNASMGAEKLTAYFRDQKVPKDRLMFGFNFYPQPYTGMQWKKFLDISAHLKAYGYPLQAFLSSHNPEAAGVWGAQYGLPTVERMRRLPIDLQYRLYEAAAGTDVLLIGNAPASEEEFRALAEVRRAPRPVKDSPLVPILKTYGIQLPETKKEIKLKVIPEENITAEEYHQVFEVYPQADFGDGSEWIWRSRAGRFLQPSIPVRESSEKTFAPGTVLVVNNRMPHYAGEVQIAKTEMENDGLRNAVGHLSSGEEELLDWIQDGMNVCFLDARKSSF